MHLNSAAGSYSMLPHARTVQELLRQLQTLEVHRKNVDALLEHVSVID